MTRKEAFELLVQTYPKVFPYNVVEPVDPGYERIQIHFRKDPHYNAVVDFERAVDLLLEGEESYPLYIQNDSKVAWRRVLTRAMQDLLAANG